MKKITLFLLIILTTQISQASFTTSKKVDASSHALWTFPLFFFIETPSERAENYEEPFFLKKPIELAITYTICSWIFSRKADDNTEYIPLIRSKNGVVITLKKQYVQAFCKMFAAQATAQILDNKVAGLIAGFATSLGIDILT